MISQEVATGVMYEDAVIPVEFKTSTIDRIVFTLICCLIVVLLVITAWSGILATCGLEDGGPLGLIARACNINELVQPAFFRLQDLVI